MSNHRPEELLSKSFSRDFFFHLKIIRLVMLQLFLVFLLTREGGVERWLHGCTLHTQCKYYELTICLDDVRVKHERLVGGNGSAHRKCYFRKKKKQEPNKSSRMKCEFCENRQQSNLSYNAIAIGLHSCCARVRRNACASWLTGDDDDGDGCTAGAQDARSLFPSTLYPCNAVVLERSGIECIKW